MNCSLSRDHDPTRWRARGRVLWEERALAQRFMGKGKAIVAGASEQGKE